MSLESVQALDNKALILSGAEKAAAGRTLGLSEEEILAAVSREYRRQKRADSSVTMEDVERQVAQAGNSLSDPAEVRGIGYLQDVEVDPFGQDQGQYATYQPGDKQYDEQERNKIKEQLSTEQSKRSPNKGLLADLSAELELNPEDRPEMAPQSVVKNALSDLQEAKAKQNSLSNRLSSVFGDGNEQMEGLAQVEGRLEDSIPNTGAENAAMKALASALVARDSKQFSPSVRAENDEYVANLADYYGQKFTAGGQGTMADEAIGRIGEVRSLGKANETAQVIRYAGDSSSFPAATNMNGVYVDPRTGQPIAVQETQPTALAGSNTPNTANQLNAPTRESATEYVARMAPDYSQGGRVFGDYPQVDITGATTLFADRVRGLAGGGFEAAADMPTNVRSIEEFDRTLGMVREAGLGMGKKFYEMEQTDGGVKSKRTKDPSPQSILNFLRYTPAEQEQLAGALYQLDAARRSSVNQNPDSMYFTRTGPRGSMEDVRFDAPEAINPRDGAAQVAKFSRGERIEGQQISEALRGLSPEAAMPFKGTVMERNDQGEMRETKSPILRQTKFSTPASPGEKGPEYVRRIRTARGQNETSEDVAETRRLQMNNFVAGERAKRSAVDREQKEQDMANRIGTPPTQTKVYGDGDAARQVEDDARRQSEDMSLSDLIRSIRSRRG